MDGRSFFCSTHKVIAYHRFRAKPANLHYVFHLTHRDVMQSKTDTRRNFDALPDSGYIRLGQLVQSPRCAEAPLPFSANTLWRMVKDGTFPSPIKFGPKTTAWKVAEVRGWIAAREGMNASEVSA